MPQIDETKLPPRYVQLQVAAQRRHGRGMSELRRLQRSPLTYGNFNLYTWYGRVFLGVIFVLAAGMGVVCVRMILERPPRLWDEWVLTFVAPLVPIVLPTLMCMMYFKHRRIDRLLNNLCPKCGFDLRASVEGCSECGWRG